MRGSAIAAGALVAAGGAYAAWIGPRLSAWQVPILGLMLVMVLFAALLVASLRRAPSSSLAPAQALAPVDVVIPVRHEDAGILRGTLAACARMRGDFSVLVVDDSSDDAVAEALQRAAKEAGAAYLRRDARRGYKAGALNDALRSSRAPFVAVLDVDHQPEPSFLEETLPRFAPRVAYVQTALAWRNDDAFLRKLAAMLQDNFYWGVQVDKGAREKAVFTGSACVFSRAAIDAVGGFPEDTLVEDFDMTLRLAAAGWKARYAPVVGARGLLPWSARDTARQLWRWSHGTTEVVRRRAGLALRSGQYELLADGSAYLAGGLLVVYLAVLPFAPWAWPGIAAVSGAHLASASAAIRRAPSTGRDHLLVPYHLVSLAFTPVLFVGSLAGLAHRGGRRREGRVAKVQLRDAALE